MHLRNTLQNTIEKYSCDGVFSPTTTLPNSGAPEKLRSLQCWSGAPEWGKSRAEESTAGARVEQESRALLEQKSGARAEGADRRNWQGRGSGYFRIRRLSGRDASSSSSSSSSSPSSSSSLSSSFCHPSASPSSTSEYGPCPSMIHLPPPPTHPPSALCSHHEYDNV